MNIFNRKIPAHLTAAVIDAQTPPPAKPSSSTVVGNTVISLSLARADFHRQRVQLEAEIRAKQEALRQTLAVLKSLDLALTEISEDPALTDDERLRAEEPFVDRELAAETVAAPIAPIRIRLG